MNIIRIKRDRNICTFDRLHTSAGVCGNSQWHETDCCFEQTRQFVSRALYIFFLFSSMLIHIHTDIGIADRVWFLQISACSNTVMYNFSYHTFRIDYICTRKSHAHTHKRYSHQMQTTTTTPKKMDAEKRTSATGQKKLFVF